MKFDREIILQNGMRLVLRKPSPEDAAAMIEYLNAVGGESDNLLFGRNEFHLTVQQEAEYIRGMNENANYLLLIGTIKGEIASISHIGSQMRKRIAHNWDLSISVRQKFWNCGVGSAVMQTLTDYARSRGDVKNIFLGVKADNKYAIRLYEKFGFRQTGVYKDFFNIGGVYCDEILMDLSL